MTPPWVCACCSLVLALAAHLLTLARVQQILLNSSRSVNSSSFEAFSLQPKSSDALTRASGPGPFSLTATLYHSLVSLSVTLCHSTPQSLCQSTPQSLCQSLSVTSLILSRSHVPIELSEAHLVRLTKRVSQGGLCSPRSPQHQLQCLLLLLPVSQV